MNTFSRIFANNFTNGIYFGESSYLLWFRNFQLAGCKFPIVFPGTISEHFNNAGETIVFNDGGISSPSGENDAILIQCGYQGELIFNNVSLDYFEGKLCNCHDRGQITLNDCHMEWDRTKLEDSIIDCISKNAHININGGKMGTAPFNSIEGTKNTYVCNCFDESSSIIINWFCSKY